MTFEDFKNNHEKHLETVTLVERGTDLYEMRNSEEKIISRTPFFVDLVIVDSDNNDMYIVVKVWKKERVFDYRFSTGLLANINNFKTTFFSKGIFVVETVEAINLLQVQETNCTNVIYETKEVGFYNDPENNNTVFITPNSGCISCTGVDIRYSLKQPVLKNAMMESGDINKWIEAIDLLKLSNDRTSVPFLLASAILPLFARIYPDFNGLLVNIIPDPSLKDTSSTGKTTLLKLMLSMQTSSKWMGTWDTTEMAIESKLYENFGAYLDDLSTNRNIESFENIIYSIANGVSRMRLDNTGTAQETKSRNVVLYSTGEHSIVNNQSLKDGAYVRFLEVPLLPSDFGSDDLSETAQISEKIKEITQQNFGFIYPNIIKLLLKDKSVIVEKIDKYKEEYKLVTSSAMWKRLAKTYALTAVAGELLLEVIREIKGDTDYLEELNYFEISKGMLIDRINFLEKTEDPDREALKLIKDNIVIKEDVIYDKNENIIGAIRDNMLCIKTSDVKTILDSIKNLNITKFIKWCISEKIIGKTNSGRNDFKTNVDGRQSYTYAFDINL